MLSFGHPLRYGWDDSYTCISYVIKIQLRFDYKFGQKLNDVDKMLMILFISSIPVYGETLLQCQT